MAKFNCVLFLGVVAVIVGMVSAITDEERSTIRAVAIPLLSACGEELGVSKEEVMAAKETKNLDALNACYYACFFKKAGVINAAGKYDPAAAKAAHAKYIHGQDDLEKLDAVSDTCASVNDQTVSDGAAGCEIAKLLASCLVKNKALLSPLNS